MNAGDGPIRDGNHTRLGLANASERCNHRRSVLGAGAYFYILAATVSLFIGLPIAFVLNAWPITPDQAMEIARRGRARSSSAVSRPEPIR